MTLLFFFKPSHSSAAPYIQPNYSGGGGYATPTVEHRKDKARERLKKRKKLEEQKRLALSEIEKQKFQEERKRKSELKRKISRALAMIALLDDE